jgi:hypothetical protein
MNFEQKYLKYKGKYLSLKKEILTQGNRFKGGAGEETTIHIYNGGSFSPPTIAHQQICIDTFNFLMNHFKDSPIDTIVLHLVPASDMYNKPSVKPDCIPYEARRAMLDIMAQNIREAVHASTTTDKYTLAVVVDDIEQAIAYEAKPDGSGPNGYIGTYKYLDQFVFTKKYYKFFTNNINDIQLYNIENYINVFNSKLGRGRIARLERIEIDKNTYNFKYLKDNTYYVEFDEIQNKKNNYYYNFNCSNYISSYYPIL